MNILKFTNQSMSRLNLIYVQIWTVVPFVGYTLFRMYHLLGKYIKSVYTS